RRAGRARPRARVPAQVRRRAGRPDERGPAVVGAPAVLPRGRAADGRGRARPRRARPERGPEPPLRPLPLPLRGRRGGVVHWGARARRRRAAAGAGGALRAPGARPRTARDRPVARRCVDRGRGAAPPRFRLGGAGRAARAARTCARRAAARPAAARARRLRRVAAGGARAAARGGAHGGLPVRCDRIPLAGAGRPARRGARRGRTTRAARVRHAGAPRRRTRASALAGRGAGDRRAGRRARRVARVARAVITSAANPRLRLVRRLASRRQRAKLGLFVCEGEDLVDAALAAGLEPVDLLVAGETVEAGLLASLSELPHPPRTIAVFRTADLPAPEPRPVAVALWHVADPGNLGTLIRCA